MPDDEYDDLVAAADAVSVEGWDFGWLDGRATGARPTWSYPDLARTLLENCKRVLDIHTGGGELLASLTPPPGRTWATEGWPPNVAVARRRLTPLGVTVVPIDQGGRLPFDDGQFDLLLNRHGRLDAAESARVLERGGILITQQVGSDDCAELNDALGVPVRRQTWDLATAKTAVTGAGFHIIDAQHESPILTFHDIGAVVYQLRMVPWQVPGFTIERYGDALRQLHTRIRATGRLDVRTQRFLIVARDQT